MKSASRRSSLQVLILDRLHEGPARTVSEIAAAVGAQRPSVSRSLKTLRNDNIVERTRNGWNLTSTGQEEAKRWNQELSSVIGHIPLNIGGSVARSVPGIRALAQSMSGMRAVSESAIGLGSLAGSVSGMRAASKSALGIGTLAGSVLGMRAASESALGIGTLAGSVSGMRAVSESAIGLGSLAGSVSGMRAVSESALEIGTLAGSVSGMKTMSESLGVGPEVKGIGITSFASYPEATDALPKVFPQRFPPMPEGNDKALSLSSEVEDTQKLLHRLLSALNTDLVTKWKGSWQVLGDSNPDKLSQAASSYRELIRMVLDKLAPDVEVDRLQQGSKRKMQVRQVLEGCERDFAEVMVEGLHKLYSLLSKYAHTSFRNGIAVQGALMAGDGLLLILLTGRRGYDSKDGKTRP